jgi:hypothetical protein
MVLTPAGAKQGEDVVAIELDEWVKQRLRSASGSLAGLRSLTGKSALFIDSRWGLTKVDPQTPSKKMLRREMRD